MNLCAKKIMACAFSIVFCTAAFAQAQTTLLPIPRSQPYRPIWTQYTPSHVHQYPRANSIANSYNAVQFQQQQIPRVQNGIGYQPAIMSRAPFYPIAIQPAIVTPPPSIGVPVLLADQLPMQTVPVIEYGSPVEISGEPQVLINDGFENVAATNESPFVGEVGEVVESQVVIQPEVIIDPGTAPSAPKQASYEEAVNNVIVGEVVFEGAAVEQATAQVESTVPGKLESVESIAMKEANATKEALVETATEVSTVTKAAAPKEVEQMNLDSALTIQNEESKLNEESKIEASVSEPVVDASDKMTLAKLAEIKRNERNVAQQVSSTNPATTTKTNDKAKKLETEMQSQVTRLTESIRKRFATKIERAAAQNNGEEKVESLKNEMNVQIEKMTNRIENRFKQRISAVRKVAD